AGAVEAKPAVGVPPAESIRPASPAARKIMADQDVRAGDVTGTGRDGRITKGDVLAAVEAKADAAKPAAAPAQIEAKAPAVSPPANLGERPEQRVPMSRLRLRVAERLLQSQSAAAILTTFNEVNMAAIIELRNRYKERFEKEHAVRLGFMGFF